jgi:hypothetical protein
MMGIQSSGSFIRIYLTFYCLILFTTIGGFADKLISSSLDANWVHTSLIAEARLTKIEIKNEIEFQ